MANTLILGRPPVTDEELWHVVKSLWGVEIPRKKVCEGHCAPFTAFADAYFARHPWYLWYGSRGTGKSLLLALLGLTAAAVDNVDVTLLGGSMAQSQNVQEHIETLLRHSNAPTYAVSKQIKTEILFNAGNWIRPLPASTRSVRGPHPSKTLLDEIDEMDYDVYTAAQGQAMEKPNALGVMHLETTVASSTWQRPTGTFQRVIDDARAKGRPIRSWCFLETLKPHGWMEPDFIERKKLTVPAEMFRTEYCGAADQPVNTSTGSVELRDVNPGDLVLTRAGWRPVTNKYFTGVRNCRLVVTDDGRSLRFTANHRILTASGWVPVGELDAGDRLVSVVSHTSRRPDLVPTPVVGGPQSGAVEAAAVSPVVDRDPVSGVPVDAGTTALDERVLVGVNDVLDPGHEAEMVGVDTGRDVAVVLDGVVDSFRDRSVEDDVTDPVGEGFRFRDDFERTGPVPAGVGMSLPDPASVVVDNDSALQTGLGVGVRVSRSPAWSASEDPLPAHRYAAVDADVVLGVSHVVSVSDYGSQPTYDLTVADHHEFAADSVIVHNCLGEPSASSRAFDQVRLEEAFINLGTVDVRDAGDDVLRVFAKPVAAGMYAAGADWAKEHDHTVISVLRTDVKPARCVYFRKIRRHPWPVMIEMFNDTVRKYHAASAHDATGLGNVVTDLVSERTTKVVMVGNERTRLLTSYISAVEQGTYQLPRNSPAYDAHRACTAASVFYPGRSGSHLPDEVASFALAHRAAGDSRTVASGQSVLRIANDPHRSWVQKLDWPGAPVDESKLEGVVEEKDVGGVGVDSFWSV